MGTFASIGFVYAFETAYLEQPTYADVVDRNWSALKRPALAGVLGGLPMGSYLMMWSPGVFLVFTFGMFVVVQMLRDHQRSRSTEYLAFTTAISFLVAAVLTLTYPKSYDISATALSLLQPLVLAGIGIGALALWGLAQCLKSEGYERQYYPPIVGGLILETFVIATVVYLPTFRYIRASHRSHLQFRPTHQSDRENCRQDCSTDSK